MTKNNDDPSTVERIKTNDTALPPSERKLADLILDFPGDIASYSATELAGIANVSKAAAIRFFRRLGYESFEQARRSARGQKDWGSPLYMLSQEPDIEVADSFLRHEMDQEISNMARTFEAIDAEKLGEIVKGLITANRIWLLGYRHSHFIADYACSQFSQIRGHVQLMISESTTLSEQLINLGTGDVVVAVGFRRRTSRFIQALKTIHKRKIDILYITEPNVGNSTSYANWVLHAEVTGSGPFDSYPAAFSLIHLLSVAMLNLESSVDRP